MDVKSACIKGKYYDEYLTEHEIKMIERWLPSLRPHTIIGIEDCMGPEADFISLHLDMDGTYMHLTIPALYFNATPDFAEPVRISGALKAQYVSMVKETSIVGYISVQDLTMVTDIIHARTMEAFFPLIVTAAIYFIIADLLTSFLRVIEIKINPKQGKKIIKGVKIQ